MSFDDDRPQAARLIRSVVDAVRCAIEVQTGMVERCVGLPPERRMEFRVGIHLGDVVEEADGDLMGDGVNIAARLESICDPGAICLSEDAYRQVKGRLDRAVTDLGTKELKNIAEPIRVYSLEVAFASTSLRGRVRWGDRLWERACKDRKIWRGWVASTLLGSRDAADGCVQRGFKPSAPVRIGRARGRAPLHSD